MLNLQRVLRDDRLLRALTGLNRKAFEELKLAFEQELLETEVPRRSQERRQRAKGAGRKPRLKTVESKLIYILFYFKCYPTFDLAGIMFDLDRCSWESLDAPITESIRKNSGEKNGTAKTEDHKHRGVYRVLS